MSTEYKGYITATDIAQYVARDCELYIKKRYWDREADVSKISNTFSPLKLRQTSSSTTISGFTKLLFEKGNKWESRLFDWLERYNLLVKHSTIRTADEHSIRGAISAKPGVHVYLSGVSILPAKKDTDTLFEAEGVRPIQFGTIRPDLIEFIPTGDAFRWRIIDAKASSSVKASHLIQVYLYTICLSHVLREPAFINDGTVAIWLPPTNNLLGTPSLQGLSSIKMSELTAIFKNRIFRHLSSIIHADPNDVKWHLNPLCRGCQYNTDCRRTTTHGRSIGSIPNLSGSDADTLRSVLRIHRQSASPLSDIEDLVQALISNEKAYPSSNIPQDLKARARNILHIRQLDEKLPNVSPTLSSAIGRCIKAIPGRHSSLPQSEDLAIIISLIHDPLSPSLEFSTFCITVHSRLLIDFSPPPSIGDHSGFISSLSKILRQIASFKCRFPPRVQFYVFSSTEHRLLHSHLASAAALDTNDEADLALCFGALEYGADSLQRSVQRCIVERITPPQTVRHINRNVVDELQIRCTPDYGKRTETNTNTYEDIAFPTISLEEEINRTVSLPIPGYWELSDCAPLLDSYNRTPGQLFYAEDELPEPCPTSEDIIKAIHGPNAVNALRRLLSTRHDTVLNVINNLRRILAATDTLKTQSRPLQLQHANLCNDSFYRKVYYGRQIETLRKVQAITKSRRLEATEHPIVEHVGVDQDLHKFTVVKGALDAHSITKNRSMYGYILTPVNPAGLPIDSYFDDITASNLNFPLNSTARDIWHTQRRDIVDKLYVADLVDTNEDHGGLTTVTARIWHPAGTEAFPAGYHRLCPRLIDFNTARILSHLVLLDVEDSLTDADTLRRSPVTSLLRIRLASADSLRSTPSDILTTENRINNFFRHAARLQPEPARSLVLQNSQRKAVRTVLSNHVAIIIGPPGTGKTQTIAAALLRIIHAEDILQRQTSRIVFVTAVTHNSIDTILQRVCALRQLHTDAEFRDTAWIKQIHLRYITNGKSQPTGFVENDERVGIHIYFGTIHQLTRLSDRLEAHIDCLIVDEASQLPLDQTIPLIHRLSPSGRLIAAGDIEQLTLITESHESQQSHSLYTSLLHHLLNVADGSPTGGTSITQLQDNYRSGAGTSALLSTIYSFPLVSRSEKRTDLAADLQIVLEQSCETKSPTNPMHGTALRLLTGIHEALTSTHTKPVLARPLTGVDARSTHSKTQDRDASLIVANIRDKNEPSDTEAALAAAISVLITKHHSENNVIIITPLHTQRRAVLAALRRYESEVDHGRISVDTVERLQGSEACIAICLFSPPQFAPSSHVIQFLLDRNRLNVAVSRARTTTIFVTTDSLLRPSPYILSQPNLLKGFSFLKEIADRAWRMEVMTGTTAEGPAN